MVANAEGRWFSFNVTSESLILLERKNLPEHLQKIENVDTVATLQSILSDLQDNGEVLSLLYSISTKIQNCLHIDWDSEMNLSYIRSFDHIPKLPFAWLR